MKRRNWLIVAAIVLLTVSPLWLVPHLGIGAAVGPDGRPAGLFGGADGKAQEAIGEIAPDYQPWFKPLLEPASSEIASLLFALQAALGAGVIGYWLGCAVTRDKLRRAADREATDKETRAD